MKNLFLVIALLSFLTILSSCRTNYYLKNDIKIDTLGLTIEHYRNTDEAIKRSMNYGALMFVNKFNQSKHSFKLKLDSNYRSTASVNIYVKNTEFATPQIRTTATILNAIILSGNIAFIASGVPFFFPFFVIPNDISYLDISVSKNITTKHKFNNKKIISQGIGKPQYLRIEKHGMVYFNDFLKQEIKSIEKQYNKKVRAQSKQNPTN
jgi:hypothetical protein